MIFARPKESATYAVGDYVWCLSAPKGRRQLGCVQSAHAITGRYGARWLVRLRNAAHWTSGSVHLYVDAALSAAEVEHNRKMGLIPARGEALP